MSAEETPLKVDPAEGDGSQQASDDVARKNAAATFHRPELGEAQSVFEDIFQGLYTPICSPRLPESSAQDSAVADATEERVQSKEAADNNAAEGDGTDAPSATSEEAPQVSPEDLEIDKIKCDIELEKQRIDDFGSSLIKRHQKAKCMDDEHSKFMNERWNLVVGQDVPVPDSTLQHLLDKDAMQNESLVLPRHMMEEVERKIEIKKGRIAQHDNFLAVSKPDEPNHFQQTATLKMREDARNIRPNLTEQQRAHLAIHLKEKRLSRPPMPPTLNSEEKAKNEKVIEAINRKTNFLKNPRFKPDRAEAASGKPCPFLMQPETIMFQGYQVGGVYEIPLEFRNITDVGRRLRVLPCKNPSFSLEPMIYEGDGSRVPSPLKPHSVIAPGMSAHTKVRFAPSELNDEADVLTVQTEYGNYVVHVCARRDQPDLIFPSTVNCGCILAGNSNETIISIKNRGGEGSFRLVKSEELAGEDEVHYETNEEGETRLVSERFCVTPASFYLNREESVDLCISFGSSTVRTHSCPLAIECDNGEKQNLVLNAIADALRLEYVRWPTLNQQLSVRPLPADITPWSLMPWHMAWTQPGVQVGCSGTQSISVANGSNLPVQVDWRLVEALPKLASLIAVGGLSRLNDEILSSIHKWKHFSTYQFGTSACPFHVEPATASIPPFSTVEFNFSFSAHPPVSRRAINFAYMVAKGVPRCRSCLLHYRALAELQSTHKPNEYNRGLPLFGGTVSSLVDADGKEMLPTDAVCATDARDDFSGYGECAVTALCLQATSSSPSIVCLPRQVSFPGSSLPLVSYSKAIILRNAGMHPAYFRVRLTSRGLQGSPGPDQLWITSPSESGVAVPQEMPQIYRPNSLFTVGIKKTKDAQLGLYTSFRGGKLVVVSTSDGLADAWNNFHPDCRMNEGDEILEVNGATVENPITVDDNFKTLQAGEVLTLHIKRGSTGHLQSISDRLDSERIPLPPVDENGHGAIATAEVFPDQGYVIPGQDLSVRIAVRAPAEGDLDAAFWIDFPVGPDCENIAAPPVKVGVSTAFRAPVVQMRMASRLDYGVVRAHARHTATLQVDNPSDLPMLACLRETTSGRNCDDVACFPLSSHQDVVDIFLKSYKAAISHSLQQTRISDPIPPKTGFDVIKLPGFDDQILEPRANARKSCIDRSGRAADVDMQSNFAFSPPCFVLWPGQSIDVEVTLKTAGPSKFRSLLQAVGFNSHHKQCLEVKAEVQLPVVTLSKHRIHFPVTYLQTATEQVTVRLRNDADMEATFRWEVPSSASSALDVDISPWQGAIPPRGEVSVDISTVPTVVSDSAERFCKVFIGEILQPMRFCVSARVFGPEVDYAVVPEGQIPPIIVHQPRKIVGDEGGSFQVGLGRAQKNAGFVDFGEMELQASNMMQVLLYNRTGIASPWTVAVRKFPANEPPSGISADGAMTTLPSMECTKDPANFQNAPQPATHGRVLTGDLNADTMPTRTSVGQRSTSGGPRGSCASRKGSTNPRGSRFDPKTRRSIFQHGIAKKNDRRKKLLLDDKHEKQAFRSSVGAEFARQKEKKAQGASALKCGRGLAVRIEPASGTLPPFGRAVLRLSCFSDLPGTWEDELALNIGNIEGHRREGGENDGGFRIPLKVRSVGNPLFLPDQQIGLCNDVDPPRLQCGTMVPAEKVLRQTFRVSNNSAAKMRIDWTAFGKTQINQCSETRKFVNLAICQTSGDLHPFSALDDEASSEVQQGEEGNAENGHDSTASVDNDLDSDGDLPFKFQMWSADLPKVEDAFAMPLTGELPVSIEPKEALLLPHGSALFTVSLFASKATVTADGHYCYRLVGKGRFTSDRQALLASADGGKATMDLSATRLPSTGALVRDLPRVRVEGADTDDSDADTPRATRQDQFDAATNGPITDRSVGAHGGRACRPLAIVPEQDVISTLVMDCVGDVIIPRLSVDKKNEPGCMEHPYVDSSEARIDGTDPAQPRFCPMFKFLHTSIVHPEANRKDAAGTSHGGAADGSQIPGIVSTLVRTISLTNRNNCSLFCKFQIDGPFRILEISQVGQFPVILAEHMEYGKTLRRGKTPIQEPINQVFPVGKLESIDVQVEFVPSFVPAKNWDANKVDHVFYGNVTIQYPREKTDSLATAANSADLQRVRLQATSRQPAVKVLAVPVPHLDRLIESAEFSCPVVEFGRVHVESSITHRRVVFLMNKTNVLAKWQLVHVGRKNGSKAQSPALGNGEEATDDRHAFHFDVAFGNLRGPSKDVLVPGSDERMPRWFPLTPALPHALEAKDEHLFEPTKITIVFKPELNVFYESRFRMQVQGGICAEIVCRGHGSYREEDDCMDFLES